MLCEREERIARAWNGVLALLPSRLRCEINNMGRSHRCLPTALSELRLRADGICSVCFAERVLPLLTRVSEDELSQIVFAACESSVYAYRDTLAEGFVPLDGGIRLGVCGHARYDGGRLVGVKGIRSLVFRLPFGECDFADELADLFMSGAYSGMLIYAPPAGGKTTAIRALVKAISSGAYSRRVCVIDERCELDVSDYLRCNADILRGYKKAQGIELAIRTLSPQLLVIDEISSTEAQSISQVARCGIPIIATAHASSASELSSKPYLRHLLDVGAFDLFVGITRRDGSFGYVATSSRVDAG